MRTPIAAILLGALVLTGCASKFNPFNWVKSNPYENILEEQPASEAVIDQRGMVDQVIALSIEKTNGGAIIHAVGLPPTQGHWDAELVPENNELPVKGVLTYSFRIEQPPGLQRAVNQQSREVVVGRFVSNIKLNGVSRIRVVGLRNMRTSRR